MTEYKTFSEDYDMDELLAQMQALQVVSDEQERNSKREHEEKDRKLAFQVASNYKTTTDLKYNIVDYCCAICKERFYPIELPEDTYNATCPGCVASLSSILDDELHFMGLADAISGEVADCKRMWEHTAMTVGEKGSRFIASKTYKEQIFGIYNDVNLAYASESVQQSFVQFVEKYVNPIIEVKDAIFNFPLIFDTSEKSNIGAAYTEFLGDAFLKYYTSFLIGCFGVSIDKLSLVRNNIENNRLFGSVARSIGMSPLWGNTIVIPDKGGKKWANMFESYVGYLSMYTSPKRLYSFLWTICGPFWVSFLVAYPNKSKNPLRDVIWGFHLQKKMRITYKRFGLGNKAKRQVIFKIGNWESDPYDPQSLTFAGVYADYISSKK